MKSLIHLIFFFIFVFRYDDLANPLNSDCHMRLSCQYSTSGPALQHQTTQPMHTHIVTETINVFTEMNGIARIIINRVIIHLNGTISLYSCKYHSISVDR